MKSLFSLRSFPRIAGILFFLVGMVSSLAAQGTPPDDSVLPDGGIPPDIDFPTDPPPDLPPSWGVLFDEPEAGSDLTLSILYVPPSGATGAFETSVDMVNWTPVGTATLQEGLPIVHDQAVAAGETLFVRWVASAP